MFYQSQWLPVFARTGSGGLKMLDGRKKKGGTAGCMQRGSSAKKAMRHL